MAFPYTSLQSDRQEMRLLTLGPGDERDLIQLSIETTSLGLAGDYTCLSYAWGPPDPNRAVELSGCPFEVRENLYLALLRLRLRSQPRRLWIDALCINQDDVKEREAQVSIIQHIYENATNVIAWIGEDNGAPDAQAIDFIRDLGAKGESLITIKPGERPADGPPLDKGTVDWLESVTPFGLVDSVWLDLTALIDRPWFSRIWIVQEVVMGKEVTVQCGRHQFPWMQLFHCALFVTDQAALISSLAAPHCLKFHDPKKAEFFMTSLPLYHLLRATENIRSVGHLAMRRAMHRAVNATAEPPIRQWLARKRSTDDQTSRLWGMMSEDLRSVQIFSTRAPPTPKCNPSDPPPPPPAVDDPSFVRHFLNAKAGNILAMANNNTVPIYSTTPDPTPASDSPPPQPPHQTLYALLARFRPFAATDPRDKVYALLGIASAVQHRRALPAISYHPATTVLDALWDVVATHLRTEGDLAFLSDACGVGGGGEGFPSWMPLWYDGVSCLQGTAVGLGRVEVLPGVVYRASGGVRAVAGMERGREGGGVGVGVLSVAGRVVGRMGRVAEVYDRDVAKGEMMAVRRRWAGVLGLGEVERLNQALNGLRLVRRISDEEADGRLEEVLGKLGPERRDLYRRFVGTLMASVSEKGTKQLVYPKVGSKSLAVTQMLGGGDRPRHFSHPWEFHVDGRIATVCHGRRMFVCELEGWGRNFGLCPRNAREGDLVALFLGSDVLHVIRQVDVVDGQHVFGLVGEAYVHDWMNGELLDKVRVPGCQDVWNANTIKLR